MTRFSNIPTKAPKGNLPVTFNKKIRSSGYGTKPEALKYSKNKQKKKIIPKLFVTRDFYSTTLPLEMHEETEFLNKDPLHTKPITKIQYSNNGALLASAALDMTISVMKTPIFEDSFQASSFAGHNGSVNSLNFSLRDEYLLSCSSDKSAIVWSIDYRRGKKALIINNTKHSLSDDSDSSHQKNTKDNPHFTHDIKKASFYFEDRFITLWSGNSLYFYKYEFNDSRKISACDTNKKGVKKATRQSEGELLELKSWFWVSASLFLLLDDVKRLQSKGAYKWVQQYENSETHSIPTYWCHNKLQSHLCILGCSNKELIVYDVNYNTEMAVFPDQHDKMIHTLEFFQGNHREDPNCYNLFYTASTDNFIRLWDLRTWSPVREFNDHLNRRSTIGWGISNCLRYLISGSEDRAVYIYDIGQDALIHKTSNRDHLDSVCDISINPSYYEWATGCFDGHVRVFRHPSKKKMPQGYNRGNGGMANQQVRVQRQKVQPTRIRVMEKSAI